MEVKPLKKDKYFDEETFTESSKEIRKRVSRAREIQLNRYKGRGIYFNSQLKGNMIKKYCKLDSDTKKFLNEAFEKFYLSARGYNKILKIARTIADLEGAENIGFEHVAEAFQYRLVDSRYWYK